MPRVRTSLIALLVFLLAAALPGEAASVLDQVPRDALGVIVVRNLSNVDAKAARLFSTVGVPLPGPLLLVKSFAGVGAGLDTGRDLLVVVLPPDGAAEAFHLALWLPVNDYDKFVRSLEGDPQRQIAAVTIAGEDLFVTRHGDWAVVMDPEQRVRLERLRSRPPRAARNIAAWETWVADNDLSLVALPAGMRTAWEWLAKESRTGSPTADLQIAQAAESVDDNPFRATPEDASADDFWPALFSSFRTVMADVPQLQRWIIESRGVGCGLKIDETGSTVARFRMVMPAEAAPPQETEPAATPAAEPPNLFDGGDFVVVGSGRSSPEWTVPAVAPYVRQLSNDLTTICGIAADEGDLDRYRRALELAVADVRGFAVLTRPGQGQDGVYTNGFLALRVISDERFMQHIAEVMRLWNEMTDKPGAAIRVVFDSRPVTVAARSGIEYSIDMASAVGAPADPELRKTMERLFGPGGKFRIQFVSIDDRTVLIAAATAEQAANAVELLGKTAAETQLAAAGDGRFPVVDKLLADRADWRVYFSPSGYNRWLKRQMDAMLGPAIGRPVVRELPASPPIGAVGGLTDGAAWIEVALPVETLKVVSKFARE